jgi:hypothetical protein
MGVHRRGRLFFLLRRPLPHPAPPRLPHHPRRPRSPRRRTNRLPHQRRRRRQPRRNARLLPHAALHIPHLPHSTHPHCAPLRRPRPHLPQHSLPRRPLFQRHDAIWRHGLVGCLLLHALACKVHVATHGYVRFCAPDSVPARYDQYGEGTAAELGRGGALLVKQFMVSGGEEG